MRRALQRWPGTLIAVIAVQAVLFRGLLRGELPLAGDLLRLFIPLKHYMGERLHALELPAWWPWEGLGMPIASQPVASLFHPTTALFIALPFQPAFALQLFLPLPFAAYGTWRLGRALGLRSAFAALAAAAYTLGGYFLSNTEFTFTSLAAAALPWAWLGALRLRPRRPRPLLLAISMALLVLAGDPVLAYLAAGSVLILCVRPRRARPLLGLAVAGLVAALLSAVLLVPLAEHFAQSARATGQMRNPTLWSLDVERLIGFVVPGRPQSSLYRSTFVGWVTSALAVLGLLTRGRQRAALATIAVLALALAAADALPLWKWASTYVPGWAAFRFPIKGIGPFALAAALLAGRGAQALMGRFRLAKLRPVLPALVIAELAWFHAPLCATFALPAASQVVKTLAGLGVSPEGPAYQWMVIRPESAGPCVDCPAKTAAPATGSLYGLPTSNAYVPGFSSEYRDLTLQWGPWWALGASAAVLGTKYLVRSPREVDPRFDEVDPATVVARDEETGALIVELARSLPRAYVSTGVRRFSSTTVPLALANEQFRRGDEVALADDQPGPAAREPVEPFSEAVVRHDGEATIVTATAQVPSMLVLNEALYRGVRAFENGAERPVLRVNHLVRGVELEPGEHTVRFEFEAPGLRWGLLLSAVGLACAAVLARWQRR